MRNQSEIRVTLSDDLLDVLQAQARILRVPLRWMIASLVCDTIETVNGAEQSRTALPA